MAVVPGTYDPDYNRFIEDRKKEYYRKYDRRK